MKIKDFELEILVNDIPLKEYKIPDSDLGLSVNRALKSYAFDKIKSQNASATFVAVPEPGTSYKIKYSSALATDHEPIKAKVYIDGQTDKCYTNLVTCLSFSKEGFYNQDFTKKYKLIFDKTEWTEMDQSTVIPKKARYGDLGVISVYFYQARFKKRKENKRLKTSSSERDLKQTKVTENKSNIDITLTTKFDEGEAFKQPELNERTLSKMEKEPIAVLHINYRPTYWFVTRGISIQHDLATANNYNTMSTTTNEVVIKREPEDVQIKVEENIVDVPIKVENIMDVQIKVEEEVPKKVGKTNKRKYKVVKG
ncbi:12645_t:CDS:2 [Funneliformis geosporum]|uniref:15606_t:CDS:1 n=1 Tax=Funneliformis geosporum TaxID=1117311 RepID=A0A9W4WQE6_9GLOM|nr:15606_t:CDS:2 [Funneliformis geosporum]CAI2182813.1 12645_t:CDS:2 [Funneliformis geosporum]